MRRLWWALTAWLAGCAVVPPAAPPSPPLVQAFVPAFEISGRLAVRREAEGFSGHLLWRHETERDEFVVETPLGQGVARVTRDAQGASLQTADGVVRRAPDVESLTEDALGFRLPLAGLPHWVQARPVGEGAMLRHNDDGTVAYLAEQGWQIDYRDYQPVRIAQMLLRLPGKLSLHNADFSLRLVIDDWKAIEP